MTIQFDDSKITRSAFGRTNRLRLTTAACGLGLLVTACGPTMVVDESGLQGGGIAEFVRGHTSHGDDAELTLKTASWIEAQCSIGDAAGVIKCGETLGMNCSSSSPGHARCAYTGKRRTLMMMSYLGFKVPMKNRGWFRNDITITMEVFEPQEPKVTYAGDWVPDGSERPTVP